MLLELQGHAAPLNCIEWSPSKRGTLASGGDDTLVLIWDLLNNNGNTAFASPSGFDESQPTDTQAAAAGSGKVFQRPITSWECDYEVSNIGWASQSVLTTRGNDWLGVAGSWWQRCMGGLFMMWKRFLGTY